MSTETKQDVKDVLTFIGIALPAAILIAVVGSSIKGSGWVIPLTTAITATTGYFAGGKNAVKRDKINGMIRWGLAGLIFSVAAVIAS